MVGLSLNSFISHGLWVNMLSIRRRTLFWMRHDCLGLAKTFITFLHSEVLTRYRLVRSYSKYLTLCSHHERSSSLCTIVSFNAFSLSNMKHHFSLEVRNTFFQTRPWPYRYVQCIRSFFFEKTSFMHDCYTIIPFQLCPDISQVVQERVSTACALRGSCCICICICIISK